MRKYAFIVYILDTWNLQCFVLASLLFQIILVFVTPMRRWSNNGLMYLVIWGVYLLASFFSTFALNLIYNNAPKETANKYDVFPFWAPFLLVHLGGPHTITALAMEDNNLWHRHLLSQIVQILSVMVVLYQYQIIDSQWLLPTAIVFLIGIVKCIERILSLQRASSNFVRKSIRDKFEKGGEDDSLKDNNNNNNNNNDGSRLNEYEIIERGYEFYQTFKGFIIDHSFTQDECGKDKDFFCNLKAEDAFKVMEMELNFMYQAMFTKMIAVQYWENNYFWCAWRFVCHALLIIVAVLIFFYHSKHHLKPVDIGVTYCLVGGAVLLDQIAIIHLIFSHWTIVKIMKSGCYSNNKGVMRNIILPVINFGQKMTSSNKLWSGEIVQYSLVKHSLAGRWWKPAEKLLTDFSLKEVFDTFLHTRTVKVGSNLKKLVVEDMTKRKAETETNNKFQDVGNPLQPVKDRMKQYPVVQDYIETSDYSTFVLILHVATEICYFTAASGESQSDDVKSCMEISQYLAYLLVLETTITSALPGSIGIRFKDICKKQVQGTFDQLCDSFKSNSFKSNATDIPKVEKDNSSDQPPAAANPGSAPCGIWGWKRTSSRQKNACKWLLEEKYNISCNEEESNKNKDNPVLPINVKEKKKKKNPDYAKSVLPDAVKVAKAIMNIQDANTRTDSGAAIGNNNKQQRQGEFWKDLSEMWAGLLVIAADHCRGDVYYLKRGGQFYTFVRLLMAHYGLGEDRRSSVDNNESKCDEE